jgi:hypothetical protein
MEAQCYRETVCENCPGTKWGKTSRCNVHGKHIGQVDTCPQWEAATAGQFPPDDMEFVQQVEEWVRDYHWMAAQVEELKQEFRIVGELPTSRYGIESIMPRGKGGTGDPTASEVIRRSRKVQRMGFGLKHIDRAAEAIMALSPYEQNIVRALYVTHR